MSWSFSPGLVAAFSEANCSAIDAFAQSSMTPMPDQFYWPDKPTEHSRISRFGMTCEPLTGDRGEALLTWFLAGFRARTSQSQEKVPDWTVSAAGYGEKWPASLARFDPDSRSWRTAQHSLLGDSDEFSVTWPRSGMTVAGRCWELPMLGRRTRGTDFGFWQTPVADDAINRAAGKWNSRGEPKLSAQVMWPTPTVCGNHNRKGASATSGDGLATAVRMWRTPTVGMVNADRAKDPEYALRKVAKGQTITLADQVKNQRMWPTPTAHNAKEGEFASEHGRNTPTLAAQAGGSLNPAWVEWLMGWPIGHTALKPSGTGKYRNVEQQHGDCLQEIDA